MKNLKNLNWLNTPEFLLILAIIALHIKKNMDVSGKPEKIHTGAVVITGPK